MAAVHARRYMLALSGLLMGVEIIILLRLAGPGWLWAWALAFGIGYGIHGPQMGAIIGDMFGRKNIGLLMTLISGIAGWFRGPGQSPAGRVDLRPYGELSGGPAASHSFLYPGGHLFRFNNNPPESIKQRLPNTGNNRRPTGAACR